MNALVSVVVSTYNRADLIGETIRSILKQTHQNIELIVVDDGSTDNTMEVVRGFEDRRIKYIFTDNWGGPARPRNIGIKKAVGEYIAFCDDDDLWLPNKLEEQLKHFDNDIDIIGLSTNAVIVEHSKNKIKHEKLKQDILLKPDCDIGLLKSTILSSIMIKKNVGVLFDERESFKFAEDFAFIVKLMHETQGEIKLLAKPLTYYRVHSGNNVANLQSAKNSLNVVREYSAYFSEEQLKDAYYRCLSLVAWLGLKIQSSESKRYYFEAFKYSTFFNKPKICLLGLISCLPPKLQRYVIVTYLRLVGRSCDE